MSNKHLLHASFTLSVKRFCFFLFCLCTAIAVRGQQSNPGQQEKCGTMDRLQRLLAQDPAFRQRFEKEREAFSQTTLKQVPGRNGHRQALDSVVVPVVFHVVLQNPALVTDAQLLAQLDTLNKDFAGANADSVRIPSYFKPFFGKSLIRFCLAQRTPVGEPSDGILRVPTSRASFGTNDDVKHRATGGDDSWNTEKYLNVWVTVLSGDVLGYASFPDDNAPAEQGVVIDYRTLPGGSAVHYNEGKTLTHETGHYFNLYHTWGDDGGLCTGTDYVEDTPNQGNSTEGCPSGVKTDACTPDGPGVMYQNYLDYSYDACLVMFTREQVARMEAALLTYRSSLLVSDGCVPVIRKDVDPALSLIQSPQYRVCSAGFSPVVTVRNNGLQTLTSLTFFTQVDNGPLTATPWNGVLPTAASTPVTLNVITTPVGGHLLTIYVANPNSTADQNNSNDTLRTSFQYYLPVASFSESFEGPGFPPTGWDVVNTDGGPTWQKVNGIANTGSASVVMRNFDYPAVGETDDLRTPQVALPPSFDSAYLSFSVAAAAYTPVSTGGNVWDTLQVLVSADCGRTYKSLYKKWGAGLVTHMTAETVPYIPSPGEWRKDSINLSDYIGQDNLLFAFRNTTGNENNIYLDDINLRTVTVNPNLKATGFLVTPNPARGEIAVQFYPQPTGLMAIQLFSSTGQKLVDLPVAKGMANNFYTVDLSRQAAGLYIVRVVFADRVEVRKVIRM